MSPLSVKATGLVTAVGFNSPASCAAMRAGIRNVNVSYLWDAESGQHLPAGKVPLPHWWEGLGKLAELVAPAIHECLVAAQPIPARNIPVLLGVSSPDRPFRLVGLDEQILGEIEHQLGFRLHPASRIIPRDHVSVVVALHEAGGLIANRKAPCVIVAAVDSLIRQDLVEHYLKQRRLLTPKNSNGFSVGEAGSAMLVAPTAKDPHGELQILGMGLAPEKATITSEEPLRGNGLTAAIHQALAEADLTMFDMDYRVTDLNGEHYKFKEAFLAVVRLLKKPRPEVFDLWHPTEYMGEIGAAIGPCVLAMALHAGQNKYAPGKRVLCHFGNDDGERAALVGRFDDGGNTL